MRSIQRYKAETEARGGEQAKGEIRQEAEWRARNEEVTSTEVNFKPKYSLPPSIIDTLFPVVRCFNSKRVWLTRGYVAFFAWHLRRIRLSLMPIYRASVSKLESNLPGVLFHSDQL